MTDRKSRSLLQLVEDDMATQSQADSDTPEVLPTDVGIRAHAAAAAHLEACMDLIDFDGDGDPPDVATMAPFCGCTDCVVREVLFAAYPILTGKAYDEPVDDHSDG